jgi:hypothetical protein
LTWKIKEPFEENFKKTMKIEKGRIERGENWGKDILFPIHSIGTNNKALMIVETDDEIKLAKWTADYSSVMEWKIYPLIEWTKIRHLFPK